MEKFRGILHYYGWDKPIFLENRGITIPIDQRIRRVAESLEGKEVTQKVNFIGNEYQLFVDNSSMKLRNIDGFFICEGNLEPRGSGTIILCLQRMNRHEVEVTIHNGLFLWIKSLSWRKAFQIINDPKVMSTAPSYPVTLPKHIAKLLCRHNKGKKACTFSYKLFDDYYCTKFGPFAQSWLDLYNSDKTIAKRIGDCALIWS